MAIQYNPIEIANNLKKNSGAIPGIRPGKPTADFIAPIVSKITVIGGLFLGIIATLPIAVGAITKMNIALGYHSYHRRWCCSGYCETAGVSDDDASL